VTETNRTGPILSESAYNVAKKLTLLILPLFGTVYFALSMIIHGEASEWILGGALVLILFFGTALRQSSKNYYNSPYAHDGEMVVIADGGGVRTFSLEVNGDPDDLALKSVISFKVRKTNVPEPPMS
jgi:hypothetical protein